MLFATNKTLSKTIFIVEMLNNYSLSFKIYSFVITYMNTMTLENVNSYSLLSPTHLYRNVNIISGSLTISV